MLQPINWINLLAARGGPTGPVQLTIAFVATQFVFKWKAPSGSTLTFNWGDGTTSDVSGNDATLVTTTSSYAGAGTFSFWITGDVLDLTYIDINSQAFVSGDISPFGNLINLTWIYVYSTGVTGSINTWGGLTGITRFYGYITSLTGDCSVMATWINSTSIRMNSTGLTGDASLLYPLTSLTTLLLYNTSVTWDTTTAWSLTGSIRFDSCGFDSTMVDNSLASFAATPVTGCTINVAGTNAARTAASDADKAIIINPVNTNTLTVNE